MMIESWAGPNRSIIDCFDWMAGTSTGGIIVLYLALGHSIKKARDLYWKLKNRVFSGKRPYKAEVMEDVLKEAFGEEKRMRDIQRVKYTIISS